MSFLYMARYYFLAFWVLIVAVLILAHLKSVRSR
jgi:hypothetical protein